MEEEHNTLQRKKKKFSQFKKRFVLKSLQLKKFFRIYSQKNKSINLHSEFVKEHFWGV